MASERIEAVRALARHYDQGVEAGYGIAWRIIADRLEDAVREQLGPGPVSTPPSPATHTGDVEALAIILHSWGVDAGRLDVALAARGTRSLGDSWYRWNLPPDHGAALSATTKRIYRATADILLAALRAQGGGE